MTLFRFRITVLLFFCIQAFHAQGFSGYCPMGWLKLGRKCYIIFPGDTEKNGHQHAEELCRQHRGTLMNVYTEELNNMLTVLLSNRQTGQALIALNDREKEGDFRWSNGSKPQFVNWGFGEPGPPGWNEAEDCVTVKKHGTWHDIDCGRQQYLQDIACEKEIREMISVTPKTEKRCGV